jgi:hypothetical protein
MIAGSTRQLVGELFEYRDLGLFEIKGFHDPIPAWQVLRPSGVASRFEALYAPRLTPLVGREEEVYLLSRLWQRATAGEGQIVLISGEPGIGKLTSDFADEVDEAAHHSRRDLAWGVEPPITVEVEHNRLPSAVVSRYCDADFRFFRARANRAARRFRGS